MDRVGAPITIHQPQLSPELTRALQLLTTMLPQTANSIEEFRSGYEGWSGQFAGDFERIPGFFSPSAVVHQVKASPMAVRS